MRRRRQGRGGGEEVEVESDGTRNTELERLDAATVDAADYAQARVPAGVRQRGHTASEVELEMAAAAEKEQEAV